MITVTSSFPINSFSVQIFSVHTKTQSQLQTPFWSVYEKLCFRDNSTWTRENFGRVLVQFDFLSKIASYPPWSLLQWNIGTFCVKRALRFFPSLLFLLGSDCYLCAKIQTFFNLLFFPRAQLARVSHQNLISPMQARPRVVSLTLSPSCVTQKKTAKKRTASPQDFAWSFYSRGFHRVTRRIKGKMDYS